MRPTKQAFQISSTKSGEGMRCGTHTQTLPVLGWQQSTSPHHSQTLNPCRGDDGLPLLPWTRTSTGRHMAWSCGRAPRPQAA